MYKNNSALTFHLDRYSYTAYRNILKETLITDWLSCVTQSIARLTREVEVPNSISGLATYFRFSFRFFKKGSRQLLAKVCARSTG